MAFDGLNSSDIKSDSEKVNKEVTMVNQTKHISIRGTLLFLCCHLFLTKELGLLSSSDLLGLVLDVLLDTAPNSLGLLDDSGSDKSVLGLELLGLINRLVDNTETNRSTTSVLGLETVNECTGLILNLVHSAKLCRDLLLRCTNGTGVKDLNGKLLPCEERVGHELLGSDDEINHHYGYS